MAIIKQICFDNTTGRLVLSDSENNHYLCDIYGHRKKTFLPLISGTMSGEQRIKSNLLTTMTSKTQNISELAYLPTIKKFEGYSKFPRPLVPPFSNSPDYEFSSIAKQSLISALKSYFSIDKAHHYLNVSNANKGIDYYTCDLNQFDTTQEDTKSLLKLIEDTFEDYRQKYKYKLNVMHKDPIVKALIHFKQVLIDNKDMRIVNGRKLNEPPKHIKELSSCVNHVINKKGLIRKRNDTQAKTPLDPIGINDLSPIMKTTKATDLVLQENEISFISNESERERKGKEEMQLVKSTETMNKSIEREIKLLTGFIEEPIKETGIVRKFKIRKRKTNGDLYMENMKTLQKVNPIAFKIREDKDKYDLKQLMIKKRQSAINDMNF